MEILEEEDSDPRMEIPANLKEAIANQARTLEAETKAYWKTVVDAADVLKAAAEKECEQKRAACDDQIRVSTLEAERSLKEREAKLAADVVALAAEKKRMVDEQTKSIGGIVKLNVGGTILTTRKSTLCRIDGSFLESMFSGRYPVEVDTDGCAFIDRDPKFFPLILSWLRDPESPLDLPFDDPVFLRELDYYGLSGAMVPQVPPEPPVIQLTWDVHRSSPGASCTGSIITTKQGGGCMVVQPVSGGDYWEVVVVSGSQGAQYWSFGVAHHGTNVSAWSSYGFDGLGWGWGYDSGNYSHAANCAGALATGHKVQVGSVVGILLTAERTLQFWHDGSFVGAHPLRVGNDAARPLYPTVMSNGVGSFELRRGTRPPAR